MGILDRYKVGEEKETVSITLDKSVLRRLRELRQQKKLKSVSPLINDLIKEWLDDLEKEEKR